MLKRQAIKSARKFRIYPTEEQKEFFAKHFGCCRFIYNHLLIRTEKAYKRRKESISTYSAKKLISPLKKTNRYNFLKEVNSQSLQASALNLGKARDKFFGGKGGYPRLKKKGGRQSFEVPQNFLLRKSKKGSNYLLIPKLRSAIKIKVHRDIPSGLKHVVMSMEPDGKYYASVNYCKEEYCVTVYDSEKEGKNTGFDLGLINLYKDNNGNEEKVPRFLRKAEQKIAKDQRNMARKKKGSNNREKARLKLAKTHSKVKHQKNDFTHKQSNKIVNENQVVYFETLNVKGMMQNHCLAKSVADAILGEFIRQVRYKCEWRRKTFVQIGRFEPSSKLCNCCWTKNNELKLQHRTWRCKECGALHDRDINAAKNIKKIGQGLSKFTPVKSETSVSLLERWCTSLLVLKKAGSGS
jgi:putative transposase